MIGEWIGQYQIVEVIGQGGMSTVYKATQPNIERDVAIKILPRQLSEDPTFIKRFQREARVIARLEHRSILPVYDYGEYQGIPYIVMRYMEAGTLRKRLFYEGLTLRDAVRIIEEVAEALDYAHSRGVIHRDLKPSNILLDENRDAFLTDFGIAKMVGSTSQVTGSGVVGTPNYMSPEQCQGKPLGPASDIYALGTILFEVLTGTPPYEADLPLTVMYMHVRDPIPSAYERNPNLPPEIDEVIQKAMAKHADDRYATGRALAADFRQVTESSAVPASAPPRPPAPPDDDDFEWDQEDYEEYEEPTDASLPVFEQYVVEELGYRPADSYVYEPARRRGRSTSLLTLVGGVLIVALMLGAAGIGYSAMSGSRGGGALFPTLPPTSTTDPLAGITLTPTTQVAEVIPSQTPITPGGILEPTATASDTPTDAPTRAPSSATRVPPTITRTATNAPPTATYTPSSTATATATATLTSTPTATHTDTPTATNTTAPSGASGELVYIEGFGTAAEIVVVDANGANRRQLTSNGYYDGEPDWSPDGTRIAFDSSPTDNRDIYTMNGSGGDVRRITTDPMAERHPDWSLDGSLIVYEGGPEVSSDIFVISADGSNPQQLTYTDSGDRAPQFSPNGTQIAFMTDRRGKWEIAIMEYPSGDVVQIYDCPAADCRFPTWSPNGARLVFNTLDGSGNVAEIWVLDVASGASSAVITGQDKGRPAYSRDGQFLFFNATTEGNVDLFRLNLSTTLVERLTISATNEYAPDWGP